MALQVFGIFCEDIRQEKSGQVSIIGSLPDNIQMPAPPDSLKSEEVLKAVMPKLGLYLRLALPLKGSGKPMPIKLVMPDGSDLPLGDIDAELIAKARREARENNLPLAGIVFHALLEGFRIMPGIISAVLDSEGKRYICAFLNVKPPISA
jgi:hypothetical protein